MKITITIDKSLKTIDALVSFMEKLPEAKITTTDIHTIETPNNTPENIQTWLSEERKIEYANKLEEEFPEYAFKVKEINISQ